MKNSISDEDLTRAAKVVGKAMHDALPDPAACRHEFSPAFQQRIETLKKKKRKKEQVTKYIQRTAIAAVLALCCTGVLLAVDPSARAVVSSWVREFYENTIVYRFFGNFPVKQLPELEIGYLPDGYKEESITETHTSKTLVFSRGEDLLFIDWWQLGDSGNLQIPTTDVETESATVNGQPAEFIIPDDNTQTTDLLWTDDERGYGFMVSAYLDMEEIMRIAESISYIEP